MDEENLGLEEEGSIEDLGEEKTSEEKIKEEEVAKKAKEEGSALKQKKHWRDIAKAKEKELNELKAQKSKEKTSTDSEKQAQKFIDDRVEEALQKKQEVRDKEDKKREDAFDDELTEVIDNNPEADEKSILDICEKEEVTPKIALKIFNAAKGTKKKEKPNLPQPKGGNPALNEKEKEEVKGKNMFQLGEFLKEKFRD